MTIVCAFDQDDIAAGPFAGVEGVGKHGYPFFRNRCFIMARAGTKYKVLITELQLVGVQGGGNGQQALARKDQLGVVGLGSFGGQSAPLHTP